MARYLAAPAPWRKVAYLAVGGLTEVGFVAGTLLLVVSHQGRGVVDTASGKVLARDRHEAGAWFDAARRAARGIGPPDGAWIGVCGLAGGQLPDATADGWQARASGDLPPRGRTTVIPPCLQGSGARKPVPRS